MLTVFGSLNVDQVFRVGSIPAPGETVLGKRSGEWPGGKGANQAVAAAKVAADGLDIVMVGCVGDDLYGRRLKDHLQSNGVATHLRVTDEYPTGTALITVADDGENTITVVPGANAALRAADVPKDALAANVALCQGEVPLSATAEALSRFGERQEETCRILNLAPVPRCAANDLLALLRSVDMLVVNAGEASEIERLLDRPLLALTTEQQIIVIVTRGADGADIHVGGRTISQPSIPVQPMDTTGAGDTFAGVFAAMISEGREVPEAVRLACCAGALACRQIGAQAGMPDRDELFATQTELCSYSSIGSPPEK